MEGLTPAKALYIVERAMKDGTLSRSKVREYEDAMSTEIRDLEQRIAALRGDSGNGSTAASTPSVMPIKRRPGRPARSASGLAAAVARAPRAEAPVSAERRKSMQLQGRYLSLLRKLPKSQRGKFQKIAQSDGREAAIAALEKAQR